MNISAYFSVIWFTWRNICKKV